MEPSMSPSSAATLLNHTLVIADRGQSEYQSSVPLFA
jgi:hypothetical protein